jgi:hypothetical protein
MPKTKTVPLSEDDLGRTLDKLEAQLNKSEPEHPDTAADLAKAMADVAQGALELATETSKRSRSRRKTKAEDAEELAKARKDDEEDDEEDDEDDDEDDDEMPAWLKDKVDDGKAAGEMVYPYDRDDTMQHEMTNAGGQSKGSMTKAMRVGDLDVVDIDDYLAKALAEQGEMNKALRRANKLHKALTEGLVAIDRQMGDLRAQLREQARFTGVMAKAMGFMLEHREEALERPTGPSRYAAMEKSVVLAQREIDANGGTVFKCSGAGSEHNRDILAKAVTSGKITMEQMTWIKRTERLPAGISLN